MYISVLHLKKLQLMNFNEKHSILTILPIFLFQIMFAILLKILGLFFI